MKLLLVFLLLMVSAAAQELAQSRPLDSQGLPIDWIAQIASTHSESSPQSQGISVPWHPAARSGGGAALPPRGGSGDGARGRSGEGT